MCFLRTQGQVEHVLAMNPPQQMHDTNDRGDYLPLHHCSLSRLTYYEYCRIISVKRAVPLIRVFRSCHPD